MRARIATALVCVSGLVFAAAPAQAGSHLWRINEVFSSADGVVQFIEMKECCGASSEIFLDDKWVRSDATTNQFTFPANLSGNTANRHLLLGTAAFAALPGAPMPDYIIPANFFDLDADTVRYWFYDQSPLTFSSGQLPLDGERSLNDAGLPANNTVVALNSPTNYAGESGQVQVNPPCDTDLNTDGSTDAADLALMLGAWGACPGCVADLNADGQVNAADLALLLGAWGPC